MRPRSVESGGGGMLGDGGSKKKLGPRSTV
jgi:hypothetical protein